MAMKSSQLSTARSPLVALLRQSDSWLEEHAWSSTLSIIGLFLASSIVISLRLKMWIDELYTYYIVHQSNASEIIQAIKEGCDGQPPLHALIVHSLAPVFGNGTLGLRLPSAIGVCIMSLCVFAFTLRRFPALYAMVAMLLALNSTRYFATEGRSYGLVLGCAGVALLCWQRAAEPPRRWFLLPGLALSLACGIALHYFTFFLLLPLAFGELARWRASRKIDFPVWIAMMVSPLVLIPNWPLMAAAKPFLKYYWARAPLTSMLEAYSFYFIRYSPALLLPAIIFFIWRYPSVSSSSKRSGPFGMPVHEWVVTGSLVLTPAIVGLICLFTTGIFVERYVVWAVIGFSVFAAAVLFRAVRGDTIAATVAVVILLAVLGGRMFLNFKHADRLVQAADANSDVLQLPANSLPIVFSNPHIFMELAFYADPKLSARFVYPVNLQLQEFYTNIDTNERLLLALRRRAPLHVPDYDDFVASSPHFLLVAGRQDWLVWHLIQSGFRVTPLQKQAQPGIFEVTKGGYLQR
jgi:Dolichyl-phosphate-mannose-protein mannosyltransferase